MINLGLKLWNINTHDYFPLLADLYKQGWFDYIELYVVPGHMEELALWETLHIPFDIHAPHSAHQMNLSMETNWPHNHRLYQEVKQYADALNARYIVFHGGSDGTYQQAAIQLARIRDPRALIENKPHKILDFIKAESYVGTTPAEIDFIQTSVPCGFCLDIGHAICAANSYRMDPYDYVQSFMKLTPKKLHLSDLDITTETDSHLHLGMGTVDFTRLLPIFHKIGDITLETQKTSKQNLDDFKEDVSFLRRLLCISH